MTQSISKLAASLLKAQLVNLGCKNIWATEQYWPSIGCAVVFKFKHGKRSWVIQLREQGSTFALYRDKKIVTEKKAWADVVAFFKKLWTK